MSYINKREPCFKVFSFLFADISQQREAATVKSTVKRLLLDEEECVVLKIECEGTECTTGGTVGAI